MAAFASMPTLTLTRADPKSSGNVETPSASVDARMTPYNSDYPEDCLRLCVRLDEVSANDDCTARRRLSRPLATSPIGVRVQVNDILFGLPIVAPH